MTKNVLFVGVGGQGIILASKILSSSLLDAGYDVKMSEVHGMAQRGGNVVTQVRYGDEVFSPIVGKGQADVILCFEKVEALRWLDYLKEGGKLIVNDYEIPSSTVLSGIEEYPKNIFESIKAVVKDVTIINAAQEAADIGNIKAQNIILLGSMVQALGLQDISFEKALQENIKEKFLDMNIQAFEKGKDLAK